MRAHHIELTGSGSRPAEAVKLEPAGAYCIGPARPARAGWTPQPPGRPGSNSRPSTGEQPAGGDRHRRRQDDVAEGRRRVEEAGCRRALAPPPAPPPGHPAPLRTYHPAGPRRPARCSIGTAAQEGAGQKVDSTSPEVTTTALGRVRPREPPNAGEAVEAALDEVERVTAHRHGARRRAASASMSDHQVQYEDRPGRGAQDGLAAQRLPMSRSAWP